MGAMRSLSEVTSCQIVALVKEGYTKRQTSGRLGFIKVLQLEAWSSGSERRFYGDP